MEVLLYTQSTIRYVDEFEQIGVDINYIGIGTCMHVDASEISS